MIRACLGRAPGPGKLSSIQSPRPQPKQPPKLPLELKQRPLSRLRSDAPSVAMGTPSPRPGLNQWASPLMTSCPRARDSVGYLEARVALSNCVTAGNPPTTPAAVAR